jgi:hypothetical protein
MKKASLLLIAIVLLASCEKKNPIDSQTDKWNGYERFLKMGEQVHNLYAGRTNIIVGTVTYGIDDNANFYVTYDCSSTEWSLKKTNMYAGDKKYLPVNRRKGDPKIDRFPHKTNHYPRVETYTYRIPLVNLPPAEEPGFAVASHALVYRSVKCGEQGQEKEAWAEGDFKFTDKCKGWYDIYYFNQPVYEYTILYGLSYSNDSLRLYHMDVTNGITELNFSEFVGNTAGTYDGAAYDSESGMLFFTKVNTGELWVNLLKDEDSSYVAGTLNGSATNATFSEDVFYYVDDNTNTIHGVTFNTDWTIASETVLDTVPSSITVNDIAMNLEGTIMYILGEVNGGGRELLSWDLATETFYSMAITITGGAQIAFGSDGILYAIAPIVEGGTHSQTYTVDTSTGSLTPIEDDVIIIDDPFSDITGGPLM